MARWGIRPSVAALIVLVGCGAAPYHQPLGLPEQLVIGRGAWGDVEQVPPRYRDIYDDPIAGPVYLLFSEVGMICRVDELTYTTVEDHALYPCHWHQPHG